jgi:hypothetical protein
MKLVGYSTYVQHTCVGTLVRGFGESYFNAYMHSMHCA